MEFNKKYNRTEFVKFLQNSFLPDDFKYEISEIETKTSCKLIQSVTKLGSTEELDLVVYEIRHKSTNDARVGLSKEAFRFLADEWENRALVIFVPEGNDSNYRFSLITIDLDETENGRLKRIYSNPRRYSYYLGEGISYYTPNKYLNAGRVTNEKDLTNRFSVEVLTKAFYQELSDWYAWAVKVVRFPNKLGDKNDDDKYNSEAVIRLVTRLIFVWFLKQKNLIPNEFFDENYIRENLIDGFNPNAIVDLFGKSYESKYYKAILQNLFFAMLNSPITKEGETELSERHFRSSRADYDNNKLMRYESMFKNPELFVELANRTVPFLNGGLFDCLDDKDNDNYVDGFSDREIVKKSLIVPDYLFFGEEVGKNIDLSEWYGDAKKKKVSARGLVDILKRYNFTVEENTPFDQDVSLDPELLGKVFENLLASYNPETQTTARKQTGSFYTPREIVQYMVDESLVAHLKRTVGDELETEYRKLISYVDDDILLTNEQKKQVMESIYHCKVLDPACGSGAFPVGMLQQMVHILSQLDPTNEQWKKMMLDEAVNESRHAFQAESKEEREERLLDIENSFDENLNNPDYARKLYLIENCIYGVDIQPIAIQISKLRFFISLVVDQKANNDPTKNFGIRPLPNLEAKFVAANSLIPLTKQENSLGRTPDIITLENKLKETNHKIFSAKTVRTKRKWKERLVELRTEMVGKLADNGFLTADAANQMVSWDMFDQNSAASFFDADWMFGIKDVFDIVIGNPPYVSHDKISSAIKRQTYEVFESFADMYCYFFEIGVNLLENKGVLCFITSNSFLRANYGCPLRKFLHKKQLLQIVDIESSQIFESAIVNVAISLIRNSGEEGNCIIVNVPWKNGNFNDYVNRNSFIYQQTDFNLQPWTLVKPEILGIRAKIEKAGKTLEQLQTKIRLGIATGDNNAFIIDETKKKELITQDFKNNDIIFPILRGQDIKRFYHNNEKYVILSKNGIDIPNNYPTLYEYFKSFGNKFRERGAKGKHWTNLRACAFFDDFKKEKIIWIELTDKGRFSYSDKEEYLLNSAYFLIPPLDVNAKYLLGVLNSKLMYVYMTYIAATSGMGTLRWINNYVKMFPIVIDCENNKDSIILLVDKILKIKKTNPQADTAELENQIDLLVYKLYNLTYDEVLIVDPETSITREEYEQKL